MKIKKIKIAAAGAWARDCELLCLAQHKGLKINYHRDGDDTYWRLQCERIIAYQVINEEFSRDGYLINMPVEGAFFEILDSPWISEFGRRRLEFWINVNIMYFGFMTKQLRLLLKNLYLNN